MRYFVQTTVMRECNEALRLDGAEPASEPSQPDTAWRTCRSEPNGSHYFVHRTRNCVLNYEDPALAAELLHWCPNCGSPCDPVELYALVCQACAETCAPIRVGYAGIAALPQGVYVALAKLSLGQRQRHSLPASFIGMFYVSRCGAVWRSDGMETFLPPIHDTTVWSVIQVQRGI